MSVASLRQIECYKCSVMFGVTAVFQNNRREDKASFYCPNGHPQAYAQSTADKLQREVDRLKQDAARLAEAAATAERERDTARAEWKRATRNAKAAATRRARTIKAVDAGNCPGCGQHFPDLMRHRQEVHRLECVAP